MSRADTDLEPRLTEALRVKAAQLPEVTETFDPTLASLREGDGRRSRPPILAVAAVVVLVVAVAVGVTLVVNDRDAAGPADPPDEVPVATVNIEALPSLQFQGMTFTTAPGLNEITFTSLGGTHSLVFEDPSFAGFRLDATTSRGSSRGNVELAAGRDYTVFCSIPGHRAAGMEAVIRVATSPEAAAGRVNPPPTPTLPEGTMASADVPEFVAVAGEVRGYVRRSEIGAPDRVHTVYGEDRVTIIGHLHPGRGFVPLG